MYLVVLTAGQDLKLRPLNEDRPTAMVPFLGRPLLDYATGVAATVAEISEVIVIGGYRYEALASLTARLFKNPDYLTSGQVGTLMVADQFFSDGFIVAFGDIVFRPEVMKALVASPAEIAVVVDIDWKPYWERRFGEDLGDARTLRMTPDGTIRSIGQTVNRIEDIQGQPIGLVMFRGRGVKALRRAWQRATTDAAYRRPILGHTNAMAKLTLYDLLDELVSGDVPIKAVAIQGGWVEIDTPADVAAAEERWNSSSASASVVPQPVNTAAAGVPAPGVPGSAPAPAPAPAPPRSTLNEPFEMPPVFRAPRRR
jgi:L-glutamine-phosphate cytidylyltransferase